MVTVQRLYHTLPAQSTPSSAFIGHPPTTAITAYIAIAKNENSYAMNKSGTVNRPMALASPIHTRSFIMKIAALYARVSTSNQQQNETIASQLDALMAYAHAHD
jgi:hypothetical protein